MPKFLNFLKQAYQAQKQPVNSWVQEQEAKFEHWLEMEKEKIALKYMAEQQQEAEARAQQEAEAKALREAESSTRLEEQADPEAQAFDEQHLHGNSDNAAPCDAAQADDHAASGDPAPEAVVAVGISPVEQS